MAAPQETTNESTVSETGVISNRPVINRSKWWWGGTCFLDQPVLVEVLSTEQIHSVSTFLEKQGNRRS